MVSCNFSALQCVKSVSFAAIRPDMATYVHAACPVAISQTALASSRAEIISSQNFTPSAPSLFFLRTVMVTDHHTHVMHGML